MLDAGSGQSPAVAVVEVDPAVISHLVTEKSPSLTGAFGDYRPPREQRIGVGDSVQITLWEAGPGGLFSSPAIDPSSPGSRSAVIPAQVVTRDGAITVPFAGRVNVIGRTPPEIERVIVERLADKAIDPQALVTVTRNVSNSVTVMGEVSAGARVPLGVRGDRLLDVIAEAGGVHAAVQDISVVLERNGRTVRVPMEAVLDDPRQNVFLQPDDVVTLVRNPQTFTTMGATGRNAVVPFETVTLNLDQALAMGGGLVDSQADPAALFVIRFETPAVAATIPQAAGVPPQRDGVPVIYHVNMRDPMALFLAREFPMRNKDVLYVSNAPLTDLQKILAMVNLLVTPAVTGVTINNATTH